MAKRPKQLRGAKASNFRRKIEAELSAMGYGPAVYTWQSRPSNLLIVIQGEMRTFRVHAGMRVTERERQLGRLETWAEVMKLKPKATQLVAVPPALPHQRDWIAEMAA